MTYFDERVGVIANLSGPKVFGMLAWIDPSGQWWMAPLGSLAPDPDRAISVAWVPNVRRPARRPDLSAVVVMRAGRRTFGSMVTLVNRLLRPGVEDRRERGVSEAGERWRRRNAERRASGCRCGRPATKVRYEYGTVGGTPAEIWTCDEHEGVNVWVSCDGGRTFEPGTFNAA